jgi:uncharacterized protein (TIGR02145 family)
MKKYYLFLTLIVSTTSFCQVAGSGLTDIDGNNYNSVIIGTQEWQKENLNVSKYSDGTIIPEVTDPTTWANLTTGAWCYYESNTANGPIYGKLYNWYAVAGIYDTASQLNPAMRKKLAPTGWHVPTEPEWTGLMNHVGGSSIAGGKMKSIGTIESGDGLWRNPNFGATNITGFTGLPGGYRYGNGTFLSIGYYGHWWSSSEASTVSVWGCDLPYTDAYATSSDHDKKYGYSIRCLKNGGLNNNTFIGGSFRIYPNPAKEKITIDLGNQTNNSGWSYKIVNMLGQEVITGVITSQQSIVPLDSLSGKGMYFVKIYDASNNLQETKKIIVN